MDSIYLSGMEFYGRHGALPEENTLGQRFIVDLIMYIDLHNAGATDCLDETVNYAAVFDRVRRIVEGSPVKLLERLADRIAHEIFRGFDLIEGLEVIIHKPGAPIQGVFKDVSIRLVRNRQDYLQEL
ncbi:MAG: dihydroneopterin aldolase [Anaerovibrio sp.]|uniref:dihydroneopterin aldolase n=1 Tax=Anaerovibrio sp. TaxID=1872532 RepID=UPI0025FA4D0A|nr:dihydroneopterin aldolase [Anaerovibrio sp.]MCR5176329.1 dihydroneopterin aldolase [Anaerovibrio sp.]